MEVSDFLAPGDVLVGVDATDKPSLLRKLAEHIAARAGLDAHEVAAALIEREKLGSTGTGEGIAIPHARLQQIAKPVGIFARMTRPVAFDSIDEKPVDLVFLVLLPVSNEGRFLSALASVARKLRNAETRARLRSFDSPSKVYDYLCE